MRKLLRKLIHILDGTDAEYGKPERGQSVVELAFMMPVLIIMITGLAEVGWFTNNYLILLEVTRVGARFGTTLSGESDPLAWESKNETANASVAPNDPSQLLNPVLGADGRIDYRTCTSQALQEYPGFYHEVLCLMLRSMEPLEINVEDPADVNQDDIVISIFSVNLIPGDRTNLPEPWASDPASQAWAPSLSTTERDNLNNIARPFKIATNPPDILMNNAPLFPGEPTDGTGTGWADAAQIVVTGRYPANANECARDYRDPFNFYQYTSANADDIEFDETRDNIVRDREGTRAILLDPGVENQRGFAYTGKWTVRDEPGGCVGSSWNLREIEAMINLRTRMANVETMAQLPPSQAFVLTEIFWQHQLLINLPVFSPMFDILGGENGSYIEVWAAFPIPSAEFVLDLGTE